MHLLVRCALCAVSSLSALTADAASAADRPLVVTTNTILADMVAQIGGPEVRIHCLVPPGADIHGFDPKPSDVVHLTLSDLVIANGAGFEPWLGRLIESSGYKGPVLEAIRGVATIEQDGAELEPAHTHRAESHPHVDPHAWQNPTNGIRYVLNIRDVLVQIAPSSRRNIERRAQLYIAQLEVLGAWMRRVFSTLPPDGRVIVTSHNSFAYLGAAARLEIIAVRGLDPSQEPNARQIAALIDQLRARKVRAIFVEAVSNPKMLEQIARDTGAAVGGELYSDSLGPAGSGADTYTGMLRENTIAIAAALAPGP